VIDQVAVQVINLVIAGRQCKNEAARTEQVTFTGGQCKGRWPLWVFKHASILLVVTSQNTNQF